MPTPELDLDVQARASAKPTKTKTNVLAEAPLELAVDPRVLVQERSSDAGSAAARAYAMAATAATPAPLAVTGTRASGSNPLSQPPGGLEADAQLLAEYGDAPRSALLTPFYAWRVFKRQQELKTALAVRKAEAEHAQATLEDALVALAERVRPVAEKETGYTTVIEELTRAEERLRSRDEVLATELDGQRGRLAQVDARIGKSEIELSNSQSNERVVATELAGAQGALAREEARIKRAESELRAAQQREAPAERAGTR